MKNSLQDLNLTNEHVLQLFINNLKYIKSSIGHICKEAFKSKYFLDYLVKKEVITQLEADELLKSTHKRQVWRKVDKNDDLLFQYYLTYELIDKKNNSPIPTEIIDALTFLNKIEPNTTVELQKDATPKDSFELIDLPKELETSEMVDLLKKTLRPEAEKTDLELEYDRLFARLNDLGFRNTQEIDIAKQLMDIAFHAKKEKGEKCNEIEALLLKQKDVLLLERCCVLLFQDAIKNILDKHTSRFGWGNTKTFSTFISNVKAHAKEIINTIYLPPLEESEQAAFLQRAKKVPILKDIELQIIRKKENITFNVNK